MSYFRYITYLATILSVSLCLACSSSNSPSPTAKNQKSKKKPGIEETPEVPILDYAYSVDTPEPELLVSAKKLYGSGLYSEARAAFEALRDGYPFGPYAELAYLKIADCDFELRDYAGASRSYEEFIKEYPAHPSADYALIRAARSSQVSVKDVGRDPAPLRKALELYDRFLKTYPNSIFRSSAETFREQTVKDLVSYDIFVMDYYKRRGNEKAYLARQSLLEQNWGDNTVAQQALGKPIEVESIALASASWGEPEPMVISERTLISKMDNKKAALKSSPEAAADGVASNGITQVTCQDNMIFVYLRDELSPKDFDERVKMKSENGELVLSVAQIKAREDNKDCFDVDDLKVSVEGSITVKTTRQPQLLRLSNPPRLVLAFP